MKRRREMSQIHKDLYARLDDRLNKWGRDGVELYEMGGLSPRDAAEDLFATAVGFIVRGAALLDLDEHVFAEMLVEVIQRERRDNVKEGEG